MHHKPTALELAARILFEETQNGQVSAETRKLAEQQVKGGRKKGK